MILLFHVFSVSLNEKLDLQEVEINEQTIVINELRNEIQLLNDKDERSKPRISSMLPIKSNDDQDRVGEEYDKKLYELENERTRLVFEHERLKTKLDICVDEKQHLMQQKTEALNDVKSLKLRILALQDQVHKLKRVNQPNKKKNSTSSAPTLRKRIVKKKPRKSCLELLLDQNQSSMFLDDLQNESSILCRKSAPKSDRSDRNPWRRQRFRTCSLCDCHTQSSLMKRKRQPSMSSTISKRKSELVNKIIFF